MASKNTETTPQTLPFELLCLIFTKAASEDRVTAQSLCRVSKTFNDLLSPILYRSVGLFSARHINRFLSRVSPKHKKFVKHLAIQQKFDTGIPTLNKFVLGGGSGDFRKCVNVEHLALCQPYPDRDLKELRPKYLHLGMKEDPCLYRPDFAFMSNVTHLRLWFVMYHTRQLVSVAERFRSVTHIRVHLDYDSLFARFRGEFPDDISRILRLHEEELEALGGAASSVVGNRLPVFLTLGIVPSRAHKRRKDLDVVQEFIKEIEEDEVCKLALMEPVVTDNGNGTEEEGVNAGVLRPRLIVLQSKQINEERLGPDTFIRDMKDGGIEF